MALSRWSPMGELASLHTAMEKLFSDFLGSPLADDGRGEESETDRASTCAAS